jgi:hypothetical protein
MVAMPQYWVSIDYTGDPQGDYDWESSYEYGSDDEADPQDDRVSSDELLVEDPTFDTFDDQKDHQYRKLRRTMLRATTKFSGGANFAFRGVTIYSGNHTERGHRR